MTRKKWRIKRVMAVPSTWQGTPERFYHFMLGYFVPLVLWQEKTGITEVAVRDSGPMNDWFDLLRPGTSVELLPPGVMLERVLSHRQERVILHDWDNPTRFHHRSISRFANVVLERWPSLSAPRVPTVPRITILERRPSASYYRGSTAELQGGGSDWRSLPNIQELAGALAHLGEVSVIDTAGMTPVEQLEALRHTDLLVAQHGGGLSNMVWMPVTSGVVEVLPPLPQTIDTIFRNLAAAKGLGYQAVAQEEVHAEVDIAAILAASTSLIADPIGAVPTPTGRLPVRLLRQLPRRL